MMSHRGIIAAVAAAAALTACGRAQPEHRKTAAVPAEQGIDFVVRDTTITATITATGIAEPFASATLSTKLTGSVGEVLVKEGDRVRAGDVLVRIDARDLDARRDQIRANIASAEAAQHEAHLMAARMRALYADSAAAKVQLDAAEAALARATGSVMAARAGEAELAAIASYAIVQAPFSGVVTQRFVDPGAFAAPGAPLLSIQDNTRLRVSATIAPQMSVRLHRGSRITATIEGIPVTATVEGIVPATSGMYTVNAIVENRDGSLLSGGAATIALDDGTRRTLLIPADAVQRHGDLNGVTLRRGMTQRWIKLGAETGAFVEVLSGLSAGDTIVVIARSPLQ